jgi:hypothetical protein
LQTTGNCFSNFADEFHRPARFSFRSVLQIVRAVRDGRYYATDESAIEIEAKGRT